MVGTGSGSGFIGVPSLPKIYNPGTANDFNWTYRLPATISEIAKDKELILAVKEISRVKPLKKKTN